MGADPPDLLSTVTTPCCGLDIAVCALGRRGVLDGESRARGAPCRIAGIEGQGLLAGDQVRIALQCGGASPELPQDGVAEAVLADGVATFEFGDQTNASNAILVEAAETDKLRGQEDWKDSEDVLLLGLRLWRLESTNSVGAVARAAPLTSS